MTVSTSRRPTTRNSPYYVLFFLSGIPALTYQIVWQRALFTLYGVNVESVTVIVTAFMVGLGLGSLAGGWLSERPRVPLLAAFGAIELGIALFGVSSLALFRHVAVFTAGASTLDTGLIAMGLLLLPTVLMGSTLPLLAAHFVRMTGNVGETVGLLYCVNTAGSAFACLAAAAFGMRWLGASGSVIAAAALNAIVGATAISLRSHGESGGSDPADERAPRDTPHRSLTFRTTLVISALVGFVALAYEIVWYRVVSYASGGTAPSFALLLGFYLAGLALASLFARDVCRRQLRDHPERAPGLLASLVVWGGIASFFVAPGVAFAARHGAYQLAFPFIFVSASLLGVAFPLLAHAGIAASDRVGNRLSQVYLANILGAAAGSLAVGFVLMDLWPLERITLFLLAAAVATALVLLRRSEAGSRWPTVAGLVAASVTALASPGLHRDLYEQMQFKRDYLPTATFRHIVETRSGVIAVAGDDTVFGGGVYDGVFSTDLIRDRNNLFRAFAISGFHASPAEVLMVGLSSGSWAQVVANNPDVRRLTIVEINPGYLGLIPRYPAVASLLSNPNVSIVIDDGRRWLVAHPERRFDLVVMNTTFHWRAQASNLLSGEFLALVRRHLKPGGILYYNTTGSNEALLTGATVFPHSLRVANFLAVSDSPIRVDRNRWEERLTAYRIDGRPVFDLTDAAQRRRLAEVVALADTLNQSDTRGQGLESGDRLRQRLKGSRLITDDNMGTEWMP